MSGDAGPDVDRVLRAEATARAQVVAALRGEDVPRPYLCDEVNAAVAAAREIADLRALTAEQDRVNARLRARVAELEAARLDGARSRARRQRAAGLTRPRSA